MTLPDFLFEPDPGEIRLTGHRIGLYHVVSLFQEGHSAEMIALEFPTLPLALVYKVIGFYLENRPAVDAYCREYRDVLDRQRAAGKHLDVEKLRARMEAIRKAELAGGA